MFDSFAARTPDLTIDLHVRTLRTSTRVSSGLVLSRACFHHLFGVPTVWPQTPPLPQVENAAGLRCARREGTGSECGRPPPALYFHFAAGLIQDPFTRATM
ncbi:hypothetical protein JTE90_011142 [Oedothorax gibbosus]|uniref:Uncharacterized protein n=1 Tax=Oedothorax gibbosus TaxID=931172 RepID=A0AAV6TJR2_9ARAC|nr:hypothetical protein JTE90_011142 [Oedothorax gibbosus]